MTCSQLELSVQCREFVEQQSVEGEITPEHSIDALAHIRTSNQSFARLVTRIKDRRSKIEDLQVAAINASCHESKLA